MHCALGVLIEEWIGFIPFPAVIPIASLDPMALTQLTRTRSDTMTIIVVSMAINGMQSMLNDVTLCIVITIGFVAICSEDIDDAMIEIIGLLRDSDCTG